MIRKVKLKFILISSFSMLLVLIIVLGVINGVSYFNSRVEIFSLMNRISENGGILPDHLEYHSIIGDVVLTEESRYTLRFFSAVVDSDGNVLEMDRGHIASISDVDAREYVSLASQRSSEEGFLYGKKDATFAYQKTELGNNTFLCVILDCTRQLHSMRQFMLASLPLELLDSARIDGSKEFNTFNKIALPIMKPAMATQGIFCFVSTWNNLFIPSILLTKDELKTMPIMVSLLKGDIYKTEYGAIYLGLTLTVLPLFIVYFTLSKYIIAGVALGGVKG